MVTSCRRRLGAAGDKPAELRHASTVVRETPNSRAATATDTPGNSLRLCSSRIPAASFTRSVSSFPAAMSCSRATSVTTRSACSYSLATDIPHLQLLNKTILVLFSSSQPARCERRHHSSSFDVKVVMHGSSVIGRGEARGCAVQPEPVLEGRGILPRPDDLPCCVAALRGGFTVSETEGLAELAGGELGAPGRSAHLLTPRLGNRARVHRVETGVVDQPQHALLAFGRVSRHRQREPARLTARLPHVCKRVGKLRVPGPDHTPAPLLLQPGGLRLARVDRFNRPSPLLLAF